MCGAGAVVEIAAGTRDRLDMQLQMMQVSLRLAADMVDDAITESGNRPTFDALNHLLKTIEASAANLSAAVRHVSGEKLPLVHGDDGKARVVRCPMDGKSKGAYHDCCRCKHFQTLNKVPAYIRCGFTGRS